MPNRIDCMFKYVVTLIFLISTNLLSGQNVDKMTWFKDAKLGIFIHWGIYSVDGVDESWAFFNRKMPYDQYMSQIKGFTASHYNPNDWINLIKESGAKYTVITSKHHDGIALWNTKANNRSIPMLTPAKKDVLSPFVDACRKGGLKLGLYFSLIDWSNPDYPAILRDSVRYKVADDTIRWNRFRSFYQSQIKELTHKYNPDLYWFDGDWEHSADEWEADKVRNSILAYNPNAILNSRLTGYGDYDTPEQNFPIDRPERAWELCMTSNNNWGYHPDDVHYKTPYEVITLFSDIISHGGNLLLGIGPREDGWIPFEQVHLLKEIGKWTRKHDEAIFNAVAGLPYGHYFGPSTLSKDSTELYLFAPTKDISSIYLKGIVNKINDITILGTDKHLGHKVVGKISWSPVPGLIFIDSIPKDAMDQYMTVIKIKLDGTLRLYRGKGGYE